MTNRRDFFRAAALSTAAVLYGRQQNPARSLAGSAAPPLEADLADPRSVDYVGSERTELFVRLEELDPADPGELSGATLRILDAGRYVALSAAIGDTLQPYGSRTAHLIGFLQDAEVAAIAAAYPLGAEREFFAASIPDVQDPTGWSGVRLMLFSGENPELRLYIGAHCLGVLRGPLLLRFFECLRRRCEGANA